MHARAQRVDGLAVTQDLGYNIASFTGLPSSRARISVTVSVDRQIARIITMWSTSWKVQERNASTA